MEIGASARLSQQTMAFVLAGGRGSRLKELTDKRAKPAVFFGGNSRIIDFALSNAINSGIRRIGVATQYKAHSLIRHLQRGWNFFRAERNEFLDIFPASQRITEEKWYLGTADAVAQNIDIIDSYGPEFLLVLAGDHVYKMDYEIMLLQHAAEDADVTVGCLTAPHAEASGFGIMAVDRASRIRDFVEKPADPPAMPDNSEMCLASMGIYAFRWSFLRELLLADVADANSSHDFGKDLIPHLVRRGKAIAHQFPDSCIMSGSEKEPYWRDVGTIDAFWQANIDLTALEPALDLYNQNWPIWTYSELAPPAKFLHNKGNRRGAAIGSMVSSGCIISGTNIRESLLFTRCHTHSYAELQGVIALPGVVVNRHARLSNTVIDRDVEIPAGMVVGEDPEEDARWFRRTDRGVCLVTKPMVNAWLAAR